ncbi:MAG: LuxR family transcriptional regulator [Algicola sp.]|nr:LuxR family transcriptional regulator [Algicola sp.]
MNLKAQEISPIQVFTAEMYHAENQNWAISQADDKHIYVANNKGLLEFNGANWKLYETPNQTILRSVKADGQRIYTGCYMEFGFWEDNGLHELVYTSLSKDLKEQMLEDEQIWNIISMDGFVLFQSLNRIYSYDTSEKSFFIIDSNTTLTKMVQVKNAIYFQKIGEGLFKIENGEDKLVTNDKNIQYNTMVDVFDVDDQLIVLTNQKGFFQVENGKMSQWDFPANEAISKFTIYSSLRLKDGSFALGTISNGIVHLTEDGQIDYILDQDKGLSNNTILSVFEDEDQNIWLGLDKGINCVNRSSPFKIYDDKKGHLGAVYASIVHNGNLYLGTNQGLFVRSEDTNEPFKFIEGTKGQVWCLRAYDNTLFCGHNLGTFIIDSSGARIISDVQGTWDIKPIPNKPDLLLQGNYNGLHILEKTDTDWKIRNKINGYNMSSKYFELVNAQQILVSHEYKGVFKLEVDDNFERKLKLSRETSVAKGAHSSLVTYDSDVLYAYDAGVFKYDKQRKIFVKDSVLSAMYKPQTYVSGKMVVTGNKLWSFSKRNINYVSPGLLTNMPQINRVPLSSGLRQTITGYENIILVDKQNYLLGTSLGYIMIDLEKMRETTYEIGINAIYNYALNSEKQLLEPSMSTTFHNRKNNFEFAYSIPEFDKYLEAEYQYKLEGNYSKWSEWSKNSSELFKNLPFGDYKLHVRGRVGNQVTKNVATYSFEIDKPWYLNNWMIAVYMLSVILFSIMMHTIYKRKYKKQEEKLLIEAERELELKQLENEQELMTVRNEQLKQDIENKNRELAISTMSLIKKNEFLNNIKDELKKNIDHSKGLNSVIKIIDKNLNNTDDWKFFEEAFNNADKDFLKKVKTKHPSLTPNDLKLCAYLRLNLSSKEIAPLLNISPKSVEVKRYRLRKKMDLPHEASLTNYILEI